MEPLFSIIIPVYKSEKYIHACVDSVLQQEFGGFEVILVDDGSPDDCPVICDTYAAMDSRVKVIHKSNGGVSKARQEGVSIASGSYLVFLDSDDWLSKNCLSVFADAINQYQADIVESNAIWAYPDKYISYNSRKTVEYYDKKNMEKKIFPMLIESEQGEYFCNSICMKTIKKNLYNENQLSDIFVDIGEDSACIKPCLYYAKSYVHVPDCLYYYRQNQASATKSGKPFDWNGPKRIAQHLKKRIPMEEQNFQEQLNRTIVHNLFNVCVSQFGRKESYRDIKKDILMHISDPIYQDAIQHAKYAKKAYKNRLALFALRRKFVILMKIYNRIK